MPGLPLPLSAPSVSLAPAISNFYREALIIGYRTDRDATLLTAQVTDSSGYTRQFNITPTELRAWLTGLASGPATVEFTFTERGVTRFDQATIVIEPVPTPPLEAHQGGRHIVAGPITAGERVELRQTVRLRIELPRFTQRQPILVGFSRPIEFRLEGALSHAKSFEVHLSGARTSAQRWGNLLREDEEHLLLL